MNPRLPIFSANADTVQTRKTVALINDELGIRLENQTEYAPGDTITGHVFHWASLASPASSVGISLHGRATSQMVVRGEDRPKTYHGSWDLIHTADHTQQLFEGPIEVSDEEKTWPFTITLPTHVDLKCLEGRNVAHSFISLDEEYTLPSTFELGNTTDKKVDGLVEYWLQAELKTSKDGKTTTVETKLPFTITNPNAEETYIFETMSSHHAVRVKSYRLLPGMKTAKLSLPKRLRTRLSFISTIPRYTFGCAAELPTDIELDGPEPVSFTLRFTPDLDDTSESLRGKPKKIKLTDISVRIITTTEILCVGPGGPAMEEKTEVRNLRAWEAIKAAKRVSASLSLKIRMIWM